MVSDICTLHHPGELYLLSVSMFLVFACLCPWRTAIACRWLLRPQPGRRRHASVKSRRQQQRQQRPGRQLSWRPSATPSCNSARRSWHPRSRCGWVPGVSPGRPCLRHPPADQPATAPVVVATDGTSHKQHHSPAHSHACWVWSSWAPWPGGMHWQVMQGACCMQSKSGQQPHTQRRLVAGDAHHAVHRVSWLLCYCRSMTAQPSLTWP